MTADSFEGLRALLVPAKKRQPFGDLGRNGIIAPWEILNWPGRWSLLQRNEGCEDESKEIFARVLLRRYGIVFRRMLERESFQVSWFDLGR